MSAITIAPVAPAMVAATWPTLLPHFIRACERVPTVWTPDEIRAAAIAGEMLVFVIRDDADMLGALAIEMRQAGAQKTLVYAALGGRQMYRWRDQVAREIEALAKRQGAVRAEIAGRPGWQREMKRLGYRPVTVVLEKAL